MLLSGAGMNGLSASVMDLNERWLELKQRPGRGEGGTGLTWEQLITEQHNLFPKNRDTPFIAAHMGWMAHDLAALGM